MNQYLSNGNYPSGVPNRDVDLKLFVDFSYNNFHHPTGPDLFGRTHGFTEWLNKLKDTQLFLYSRRTLSPPGTQVYGMDQFGEVFYGLNFASADYLGLSQSELSKQAAIQAAQEYGVNSCGSPLAFGASQYYFQLIEELKAFWDVKEVMIFSTCWMAGFGVIKCLVQKSDYVIMDELSHNCLIEGSRAATNNVIKHAHLDMKSLEEKLKEVRSKDKQNGILVITEGLFSMDADTSDLVTLQKTAQNYNAFVLIDCAHDFGCMGPNGRGTFQLQGLKDFSNVILMGGGSKCLSTNLGWIGCNDQNVIEYMKVHCTSYMFTNAINPIQGATALAQLRILSSQVGTDIRNKVIENYHYVKGKLNELNYRCIGQACPILIVFIGNEIVCRLVSRIMMDEGIHVNGIEYPVVALGQARLRLNLMPQHTQENLDLLVTTIDQVFQRSTEIYEQSLERLNKEQQNPNAKL